MVIKKILLILTLCTLSTWHWLSAQCIIRVKAEGLNFVSVTNLATKETAQTDIEGKLLIKPEWENKLLRFSAIGKKDTIVYGACGLIIKLNEKAILQKTVTISNNLDYLKEVADNSNISNLFAEGFYTAEIEEIGNPNTRCEVVNASIAHVFSTNKRLFSAIQRVGIDSCRYCFKKSFTRLGREDMSSDLNEYQPSWWFSGNKSKIFFFTRLEPVIVQNTKLVAYLNNYGDNRLELSLLDTVNKVIVSFISVQNKIMGEQTILTFGSFLSKDYFIGKVVNSKLEPAYISKRSYVDRVKNKIHTYNFHFYRYNTPMQESSYRIRLFGLGYWGDGIEPRFKNLSCRKDCNVSIDAKPPKPTFMSEEERLAYIKVLDELAAKYITIDWDIKKPAPGVNWEIK